MNQNIAINEILTLLREKNYKKAKDLLIQWNSIDLARCFSELAPEDVVRLFRILPKDLAADTFVEMDTEYEEMLIRAFTDNELRQIVDELYVDDVVDIIEEMPANVVDRILRSADEQTRAHINTILKYPQDSAGSIMTTEFVNLKKDMTVKQALQTIRRKGVDSETIDICYVTDNNRRLFGFVSLRDIVLANENDVIDDIMDRKVVAVQTTDDQEEVAMLFAKYDMTVLPVVDKENRLVGIVTVDDAIDVMQMEAAEDMEKMAAITPAEKPYLKTSVFEIWKNRIPWLLLLMISATFTGMIIAHFEDALQKYVILTSYIPMLMDTGGNSGSQASVTIIRGISLNEISLSDVPKIVWKELRVAVLCGITMAVVNFFKLILLDRVGIMIAAVVCMTLVMTVFVAKLVGGTLPMLAKKLGFDPVVMASPFITTIVDALSLVIYFKIASVLLGF